MNIKYLLTVIVVCALALFFAGKSHALRHISVNPNLARVGSPVKVSIVSEVGEQAYHVQQCDVYVNFGDGKDKNIGKCVYKDGACTLETTHSYRQPGSYTIKAYSYKCKYDKSAPVQTSVSILPGIPGPYPSKKRP